MKKRKIKRELMRKFRFEEVSRKRHQAVAFFYGGKKVATMGFSRSSGTNIDDPALLGQMAREVRVGQLRFFKEMIDCTKSYEDYIDRLRQGGCI
jgi:hypothetical protein